ncbi:MAG: cellulase family glycosylhydrolase [Acetatifactor sp.]
MKKKTKVLLLILSAILCISGVIMLVIGFQKAGAADNAMANLKNNTASSEAEKSKENSKESEAQENKDKDSVSVPSDGKDSDSGEDSDGGEDSDKVAESDSNKESEASKDSDKDDDKDSDKDADETPEKEEIKDTLSSDLAVPSRCGALSVNGTQLVDQNGNPVQLRGISTHGLSWFPNFVDQNAFRQFREEWNVNVMRLAMYTHENGGYCTDGNKENLKNIIYRGVQYATDNDMYVIIDWHVLQEQNPNVYKEEAKKFFSEMSEKYKDYNNVIYEICNEPNGGVGWSEVKSYAEEIIPIIRANDEKAIILVGTPNWSQRVDEAANDPITGYDNIMYTLHFYAATHKDDLRNTMVNAINAGLPVFVSEYGICDASGNGGLDKDSAQKWVDTMNSYGVSYICWALANKNESAALIKSSCSKTSGFDDNDLSESGKWLYQTLTGNAVIGNSIGSGAGSSSGSGAGGGAGSSSGGSTGSSTGSTESFNSSGLEGTLTLQSQWEADGKVNYQYNMTLTNNSSSSVSSWAIDIHFSGDIGFSSGWGGTYTVNGNTLHVISEGYNGSIPAGGTLGDLGFIITGPSGLKVVP